MTLPDMECRELATEVITDFVAGKVAETDGRSLVQASERTKGLSGPDQVYVGRLIDSALVQLTVDWMGGTPA